jgi:hypothetical protein
LQDPDQSTGEANFSSKRQAFTMLKHRCAALLIFTMLKHRCAALLIFTLLKHHYQQLFIFPFSVVKTPLPATFHPFSRC